MGINWRNVIKDQARGMDPASAYYKEDRRQREAARREDEKRRAEMLKRHGERYRR